MIRKLFTGLSLLAGAGFMQAATPVKKPNILFILSDDHTSQSWGVYGGILSQYAQTDNIRRLAAEGCVLDNCFCTNSISVPSRASILTGAYSHRNGVYSLEDGLASETDNIAKQMQAGGYQTAVIGKWHLKKKPEGFDSFAVFHDQGDYFNPVFKTAENWVENQNIGEPSVGFSTDIVTDKTIDWIKNRSKDSPFMLCCHFKATHEPWLFPERMKQLYDDVVFPEPANLMEFDTTLSERTFIGQQIENLTKRWESASKSIDRQGQYPELPFSTAGLDSLAIRKKTYQKLLKDYLRCAAVIDENIGRLLNLLDEEGLTENTIVVYVSDQGYFLGEHGFMDKRMMYEESLRMPCVIRYPKEIKPNTRNKDIILNIDFASLLADYAEIKPPQLAQGHSFRSNLRSHTPTDWRKSMYYRYWTQQTVRPAHLGIRTDQYKLMFLYGDRLNTTGSEATATTPAWEFYDLQHDPHENHNRYNDPANAEVIRQLKQQLFSIRKKMGDTDDDTPRMQKIINQYYW